MGKRNHLVIYPSAYMASICSLYCCLVSNLIIFRVSVSTPLAMKLSCSR